MASSPDNPTTRLLAEAIPSIIASFVISVAGGGMGVYVGYRLVEQRVSRNEADIAKIIARQENDAGRLSRIEANTEYIRGRLESDLKKSN